MAEIKTKRHDGEVFAFIEDFADTEQKKIDSYKLIEIMQDFTSCPPKLWGPSIIGFGMYHYESERSSQKGDWPIVGFSPRKSAISLYIYSGMDEHAHLLEKLGKFKMGKACIYIKKLSDIHVDVMCEIMGVTIDFLQTRYQVLEGSKKAL
jgi:hypothetical protein